MHRYLLLVLATLLLPSVLPAQPNPDAGPEPPPPPIRRADPIDMMGKFNPNQHVAMAEATPNGLFLLGEGVLARYSPDLEQCATLQLLPPLPPLPMEEGNDKQAMQKWFIERALRNAPPAMLPDGDMLYIVYSGTLFRVNQNTLKVEKTMLEQQPQPGGDLRQMINVSVPPLLKLQQNTLYIIRQSDLFAVDLKTGVVLKRADLPKEMLPILPIPLGPVPDGMQQGGKQFGAGEAARAITVVGMLGSRKVGERMAYLLKDDAGVLYLLAGEQMDRLVAQGDLNGKRARVTGMREQRGVPAGVNSILRVQAIQLLGE